MALTSTISASSYGYCTTVLDPNGLQYAVYCGVTDVYAVHFENGKLVEEKIEGITSTATSSTQKSM